MWGATALSRIAVDVLAISIHAPRVGSDRKISDGGAAGGYFNPRSPCGERLANPRHKSTMSRISIHAPRVGSDTGKMITAILHYISIHAPRVGSDGKEIYNFC